MSEQQTVQTKEFELATLKDLRMEQKMVYAKELELANS